jgi:pilus assembly protein CpaC
VLGVFFGTHADQKEDVEGAVFIIPSIVESAPVTDIVKAAMAQYEEYSGDIDEVNSYPKAPPSVGK